MSVIDSHGNKKNQFTWNIIQGASVVGFESFAKDNGDNVWLLLLTAKVSLDKKATINELDNPKAISIPLTYQHILWNAVLHFSTCQCEFWNESTNHWLTFETFIFSNVGSGFYDTTSITTFVTIGIKGCSLQIGTMMFKTTQIKPSSNSTKWKRSKAFTRWPPTTHQN